MWAPEAAGSGYKSAGETYRKVWPAAARTGGGNCPPLAQAEARRRHRLGDRYADILEEFQLAGEKEALLQ